MARTRTVTTLDWTPDREAALRKATAALRSAAEEAVQQSAEFVLEHERSNVPVRTGRTRAGLGIETNFDLDGLFEAEVAERDPSRAHVAIFLNQGTSAMPATRFADNAVKAERRRMSRRVSKAVKRELAD